MPRTIQGTLLLDPSRRAKREGECPQSRYIVLFVIQPTSRSQSFSQVAHQKAHVTKDVCEVASVSLRSQFNLCRRSPAIAGRLLVVESSSRSSNPVSGSRRFSVVNRRSSVVGRRPFVGRQSLLLLNVVRLARQTATMPRSKHKTQETNVNARTNKFD
jgi:hypothetical protein